MTTLMLETEPIAEYVTVTDDKLIVDMADGRCLSVPLAWYPRLFMRLLQNAKIGNYSAMLTPLNGQIWMSISELKAY